MQKENCIFCKIIKGEIPSTKVFEDDKIIGILDINPAAKGHVLVMPKEHYPVLPAVPPAIQEHMFKTLKYLVKGVREGGVSAAASVFIANGAVAGQQSPHFLFHIIPRDNKDGLIPLPVKTFPDAQQLTAGLKANVVAIIGEYMKRMGLVAPEPAPVLPLPPDLSKTPAESITGQLPQTLPMPSVPPTEPFPIIEVHKDNLASAIEHNPELKRMILENPAQLKEMIKTDKTLETLFIGISVDKLSKKLQEIEKKSGKKEGEAGEFPGNKSPSDSPSVAVGLPRTPERKKIDNIARLFTG
ncbi:MAG: HIT domain-containing protein [Nanoarchaeota archaeon]|nr:HIT domain-containing protein [Nanoarchaeota archaeon]